MRASLPNWIASVSDKRVVFGLDGVLDGIYSVVLKRSSVHEYELVHSIAEWADIVKAAAGSATNFEIIEKKRSTGGFVANTSASLLALAAPMEDVTLIGGFGTGEIAPPFKDAFQTKHGCNLVSIGEPGYTHAYEFDDGKLMLTSFASILSLGVGTILAKIPEPELIRLMDGTALFGLGYWSVAPGMTDVFRYFATRVFPLMRTPLNLFLDLASLRKRSDKDIREMTAIINQFPENVDTTLSLNDKEAVQLHDAVSDRKVADIFPGIETSVENKALFVHVIKELRIRVRARHIIVHTPRHAFVISGTSMDPASHALLCIVPNAYTKHASFTVAAGDAFSGGVALGLLAGCTPQEMVVIGNVAASHFIRTGQRCTQEQAIALLRNYRKYLEKDHPGVIPG